MDPDCGKQALLFDQHPLWLDAVEMVLRSVGIEVVGKTAAVDEVGSLLAELDPSLLIAEIDVGHSEQEGLRMLHAVRDEHPDVRVIVLSQRDDSETISQALAAGAAAYVVKTAHPDDFAAAVRQQFGRSLYIARRPGNTRQTAASVAASAGLSRREIEILKLVSSGQSNRQLARALWVTEQTVKFHLSNIYRKLNVSNRTEASRWAELHGLASLDASPAEKADSEIRRAVGLRT